MNENKPIVVEQAYTSPIEKVWESITDSSRMRQWFFENIDSFKPEIGFQTAFNVHFHDKDYLHVWKVTEVIPGKKIVYQWKYGGYPGDSYVAWELSAENNLTKLKLTHSGMESFPRDNPDFAREVCTDGWNFFIRKRLKEFLEN